MISVRHLSKTYHNADGTSTQVLKDVNFDINPGEVISVIGPSGTGKSTLLRCLNLMESPSGGSIFFEGEDVLAPGYPVHLMRRKMGMVFQDFNLFGHLTAIENVMLSPCKLLGISPEQAREEGMALLMKVGLADKADAYPDSLSGGQKQRVAIARALAMHPEIILFDEPTSALDPSMIGEVLSVIRQVAAEGMTMMIVTHGMKFAREISSRIFFMYDSTLYEDGTPEEIFTRPIHSATKAFIQSIHKIMFEIDGPSFDMLSMRSAITSFCTKYNIHDKAHNARLVVKEMVETHLAAYRPLTVRMTWSEINEIAALDFMIEGLGTSPLESIKKEDLQTVRSASREIIEEPTTRGFRVKVIL